MTVNEAAKYVWRLVVGREINGEHWTWGEFLRYVRKMMKTGDLLVMEIVLPDGHWYCAIDRYKASPDGFDYIIPFDRDEEARYLKMWGIFK